MTKGDASSHLKVSAMHVRFESLVAREFGQTEVRRMVSTATPARPRPENPATPVAWAAAAASRVAAGQAPGAVVAGLGDLGVFCVALGAFSLLSTMPTSLRANAYGVLSAPDTPGWMGHEAVSMEPARLPDVRERLEAADTAALRTWTVALLPMVVDVFARQAPRWWRFRRPRFARMVLHRLAVPAV
jgi:hypothetical protein